MVIRLKTLSGLHLDIDSGNLWRRVGKGSAERRDNLAQLRSNRPVFGKYHKPAQLEIGYPCATHERTWNGRFENALHPQQASSMIRKVAKTTFRL